MNKILEPLWHKSDLRKGNVEQKKTASREEFFSSQKNYHPVTLLFFTKAAIVAFLNAFVRNMQFAPQVSRVISYLLSSFAFEDSFKQCCYIITF